LKSLAVYLEKRTMTIRERLAAIIIIVLGLLSTYAITTLQRWATG
jgi:hypothetical protein